MTVGTGGSETSVYMEEKGEDVEKGKEMEEENVEKEEAVVMMEEEVEENQQENRLKWNCLTQWLSDTQLPSSFFL